MRTPNDPATQRAMKLVDRLAAISDDEGLQLRVTQIRDRLRLPMSAVLERVPGDTVIERAKSIGVTRQAYYAWLKGSSRPSRKQARRLAFLTGYDAEAIRGRPMTKRSAAARAAT
jgi:transcriptional regulator with XRE-family HTH domain